MAAVKSRYSISEARASPEPGRVHSIHQPRHRRGARVVPRDRDIASSSACWTRPSGRTAIGVDGPSASAPRCCGRPRRSSGAARPKYARAMALEMGKPLDARARRRPRSAPSVCDYYADNAAALLAQQPRDAGRHPELRTVRPDRRRARRDALEFSVLAGVPLRRAGARRGQRRAPEARLQRDALRAPDRGGVSRGGVPGRDVPHARAPELAAWPG